MSKARAYYNEFEPYCVAWLRNLIKEGLIADGDVDDRDIRDVQPSDLRGYTQAHFFAGLGGWSYALRLAEWPDDRPVWTGSCPCQPFSSAGKRKGFADDRHLWPKWFRLIRECRPSVLYGEQVARAIGQGWLDTVADDLEDEGYAIGSAVLPACAVAAPHERERLWFVANANGERQSQRSEQDRPALQSRQQASRRIDVGGCGADVADPNGHERHGRSGLLQMGRSSSSSTGQAQDDAGARRIEWPPEPDLPRVAHGVSARVAKLRALGNAIVPQVAAEFIKAAM